MSSTDYNYDDQGQFFPFFVITIAALVTVPVTYNILKPSKQLENTAPRIDVDFQPAQDDLIKKQRQAQKRREFKLKRTILALAGWALIAYMVYLIVVTARSTPKIWDPWEVLGISRSANDAQIKKHFKRLSLTQHPDKRRPDSALNLTLDDINEHWVEVTKAFKTLTDEDVKRNYELYGNPDGKQSFSVGIALPQFIVVEGNGKYVLLLYAALLGVVLPLLVGRWWYGTQSVTRDGILVESASKLFTEYKEAISEGGVVGALSAGVEYKERLNSKVLDQTTSKIETRIMIDDDKKPKAGLSKADSAALLALESEERRKVLGLLWAYLGRIDLEDAQLDEEKYAVAPVAFSLNEAFASMTLAFNNLKPLLSSFKVSQSLIQAIPPEASPLLQLPYFTPQIARALEAAAPESSKSIQNFMDMTEAKRRRLLVNAGHLNSQQYNTAIKVASQIPYAHIERAFFKVTGEKILTPGSLIQLVVKFRIIPPGTTEIPAVNKADLNDPDPKEGDLDALHGRKKTQVKGPDGNVIMEDVRNVQAPLAHAPYYARDHSPRWKIFLAEPKSGKIAVPPFTFSTFEKEIFNEDGTPTFNVQTWKMQFAAPPQQGAYNFAVHLVCDSYVGFDSKQDIVMKIEDASHAEHIEEEDEISEPEEDSLAGQMNALKGGGQAPPKKKKVVQELSDEDDSETDDDEEEDSETDTDTDTDEE